MNRRTISVVAAMLVAIVAFAGAATTVVATRTEKPNNVAATRAYLHARHAFEIVTASDGPADMASSQAYVAKVSGQCPNALLGAPAGKVTEEITREADDAVDKALEAPERRPSIAFARRIEGLRWTDRRLTYYARGFAAETRATAELGLPDLCADARSVAADHYTAIPASTTRYIRAGLCASSKVRVEDSPGETGELDEIIAIMLRPYERSDERPLLAPMLDRREREAKEHALYGALEKAEADLRQALGLRAEERPLPLGAGTPTCLSPPPR